jgi:diguanylate cyclase (GGDEF)-like protein
LIEPLVAGAVAMVALTSVVTALAGGELTAPAHILHSVAPVAITSGVASVLVMSLLYHELRNLFEEMKAREETAKNLALHDQLTGLPNRALLHDRLEQALARQQRDGHKFALLMLDLDHFKQINDTLGHCAGDLVVKHVAERIAAVLRQTDTVARIGGDEFAILLNPVRGKGEVAGLCGRIMQAVSGPVDVSGRTARVTASIGALFSAAAGSEGSDLMRKADITLYKAKSAGRGCFKIFSEEMDAAVQRRDRIELRLRKALGDPAGGGLALHYQPQVSRTGQIVGFEGLLRWRDPELGQIAPDEVIPIAEETGLIHSLGEFVFREACRTAKAWPDLSFAVNLSPAQFRAPQLPERLARIAAEADVPCRQIELEITETLLIEHGDNCAEAIQHLRRLGFNVALDDFGTGYSSLGYLRQFRVDKIKLDRSFLERTDCDQSVALVRAAVQLGHAMQLEVVAEGISRVDQEAMALQAGCTGLQGFLYARALPPNAITEFMTVHHKRSLAA